MTDLEMEIKQLIVDALNLEDVLPGDIDTDAPLFGDGLGLDSIDVLELTVAVVETALKGWELHQEKQFAATFDGGHYTDPHPDHRVREFWSDGHYAKVDRDHNGHFETIFVIDGDKLVYVGSIGPRGTFMDVASPYNGLKGQSIRAFLHRIKQNRD